MAQRWIASSALAAAAAALLLPAGGLLKAQGSQAAPAPIPVPNASFEEGAPGETPPSWHGTIRPTADAGAPAEFVSSIDRENPGHGRASVRLESATPAPNGQRFGTVTSSVDAVRYRGRRIRLTGAVRSDVPAATHVGLWLRIDRAGRRHGFFDNMADRSIRSSQWADYAIEADVDQDAQRIVFGLLVSGSGRAWMDNVRLEDLGPAAAPAASTVTAAQNLEAAITLLRRHHINSASADWPRITAAARERNAGAQQARDSYDAIQSVIDALGERHTMLRAAPSWTRPGAASRPTLAMPTHELIDGRYGLVRLPAFLGSPEEAQRYTSTLRDALIDLDRRGVCGWIVDLRDNSGGNMWPMLQGLDPLLGAGPFGSFRPPSGALTHWIRTPQRMLPAPTASDRPPAFQLRSADAPVAVLLGPRTASSGEMTAMALIGRPGVRSFGAPSAGFSTANGVFPLPDGAWLMITTAYARDRTGREYSGAMQPDEATELAAAPAAAQRWLASQPCRQGSSATR